MVFGLSQLKIFGGLYLGWGIGANDSANIFGTAVATRIVSYRTATVLIAVFVVLGAVTQGPSQYLGLDFAGGPGDTTATAALIATLATAVTVTVITWMAIPASTSQAAVGGLMGVAVSSQGLAGVDWAKFLSMLSCWVINPVLSAVICFGLLKVLGFAINRLARTVIGRDRVCFVGLVLFGCYGAFALGANNVVVTTAAYFHCGAFGPVDTPTGALHAARLAALAGSLAIAAGALTYSRKVMMTVGTKVTPLNPFSALVVVLTAGLALNVFSFLHVPVSSSQAVVGALIGVSLHDQGEVGNVRELLRIFGGWLLTPFAACLASLLAAWGLHELRGLWG